MAEHSTDSYDAVVIGAGVIGSAVTFELARRGKRVCCVDRNSMAGIGSTASSSAIIRFSYSTRTGVAASWEGAHYWKDWANYLETPDPTGLVNFVQCGMAILNVEEGGHHDRVRPIWDELAVPYEEWTSEQLRERMPLFDHGLYGPPSRPDQDHFWADPVGSMHGAIFSPDAGYIDDPQQSAHNLQVAAEAKGAEYRFTTTVTEIVRLDGRCAGVEVTNSAGQPSTIHAPVVVNVAGPHSSQINALADVLGDMNIATRPMRHETHQVPGPSELDFSEVGFSCSDDDNGIYFRPHSGNNVLIGSADPDCDTKEWLTADEVNDVDLVVSQEQWETQVTRMNKRMPSLGIPHQKRGIVGVYDVSDDWLPIYDRTSLDGFYVAIGTSGNQFKNAPVAGHMVAELIDAVESGHDHDADPLIVKGRYTGHDLEMATFRRGREITSASPMSVHG